MGTSTHLAWVLKYGFLAEEYQAKLFSKIFWDSLTFLDPMAAILLFLRPKIGLFLTLGIIIADVVHNNLVYYEELYFNSLTISEWFTQYWMIVGQIIFMIFVLISFKPILRDLQN